MDLVGETEGYLPNDLKILCHRIYHQCLSNPVEGKESENVVETNHIDNALSGFTPSSLRGVKLQKSGTSWSDIGGLTEAKRFFWKHLNGQRNMPPSLPTVH